MTKNTKTFIASLILTAFFAFGINFMNKGLTNIFLLNEEGRIIERMMKEGKDYFKFQPLSKEEYKTAVLLTALDQSHGIYGKAYKFLPGDIPAGLEVLLLEQCGLVIQFLSILIMHFPTF